MNMLFGSPNFPTSFLILAGVFSKIYKHIFIFFNNSHPTINKHDILSTYEPRRWGFTGEL